MSTQNAYPSRNHLILTENLAVHGQISPVAGRLADHLSTYTRKYIKLLEAKVTNLTTGESEHAREIHVAHSTIILAHEFVDVSSDAHLRAMNTGADRVCVRMEMRGLPQMTLQGIVGNTVMNSPAKYIVLSNLDVDNHGLQENIRNEFLKSLPYVIVNRDRIEAWRMMEQVPSR